MKLVASLTERTTAATDVILSGAAAGVVIYLQLLTHNPSWRISLWSWSFILIAVSAGCGAAYHGLSLAETPRKVLWQAVTICMGMAISIFLVAVVHDAGGPQSCGIRLADHADGRPVGLRAKPNAVPASSPFSSFTKPWRC